MPFQEIGKFPRHGGVARFHDFKRPVTFYDRVRFVGADSSVEILGGVLTGDFSISGDLKSSSWDGGDSLASAPVAATAGYFLDYDQDKAQFQDIYAVGGQLEDLTVTGVLSLDGSGQITTDSGSGSRMTINPWDGTGFPLIFYTGAAAENNPGSISVIADSNFIRLTLYGPTLETSGSDDGTGYLAVGANSVDSVASAGLLSLATGNFEAQTDLFSIAYGSGDAQTWIDAFATGAGTGTIKMGTWADTVDVHADIEMQSGIQLFLDAGSISDPGLAFVGDPDTGIYNPSANVIGFVAGGGLEFTLGDGYLQGRDSSQSVYIRSVSGSVGAPQYSFRGDGNTGMYWYGADQLGFAAGGAIQFITGNSANPSIRGVDGTSSAPSFRFINDSDTGIYLSGTNRFSIACGGNEELALSTTGFLVPNVYSATSMSSANVFVDSLGQLFRSTSARKYKEQIEYADWLADYDLRPVRYKRKDAPYYLYGFIADELAEEDDLLGVYNDQGEVEDYDTRAVIAVLAMKVNRLEALTAQCSCGIMTSDKEAT